ALASRELLRNYHERPAIDETTETTRPQTTPRRIVAVDDEQGVCNALRRSLRREGYDITTCCDPKEALEMLKTEKFDMLISDHLMPGMTGLQLTKLCHDRYLDMSR